MLNHPAITLIPFAFILVGFGLFWFVTWQSQNGPRAGSQIARLVVQIVATILLTLGVLGTIAFMTGPLVLLAIPVGLVILLASIIRYRGTEGGSLIWALTVAAERGIPLETAARAFSAERGDLMGKRAQSLASYLESAVPLSLALKRCHFIVAPEVQLAADLGQQTGALGPALRKITDRHDEFESGLRSGLEKLFYLVFLIIWMASILLFMMIKIVPVFSRMFEEFGLELPALTRLLIQLADLATTYALFLIPLCLLILVGLVVGLVAYIGLPFTSLPLVRRFAWFRQLDSAVILRLLALAIQQGRSISESVRFLAGYFPQPGPRSRLERAANRIHAGSGWQDSFSQVGFLSKSENRLLESAERVGNLSWALDEMADSKTRQITYRIRAWISLLFPLSILMIGLLVMLVSVSLMLPLFKMIAALA